MVEHNPDVSNIPISLPSMLLLKYIFPFFLHLKSTFFIDYIK